MHNENARNVALIVVAVMLLTATAASLTSSENAIAYSRNQAIGQTNDCGNGELPTNIGCQNTVCQIQGDENLCALASRQSFPVGEEGPPPTPTCEECFQPILDEGFPTEDLVIELAVELGLKEPTTTGSAVEEICQALESGDVTMEELSAAVEEVFTGDNEDLGTSLIECLSLIFGGGGIT